MMDINQSEVQIKAAENSNHFVITAENKNPKCNVYLVSTIYYVPFKADSVSCVIAVWVIYS